MNFIYLKHPTRTHKPRVEFSALCVSIHLRLYVATPAPSPFNKPQTATFRGIPRVSSIFFSFFTHYATSLLFALIRCVSWFASHTADLRRRYSEKTPREIEQLKVEFTFFPLAYFITVKRNSLCTSRVPYWHTSYLYQAYRDRKKSSRRTVRILLNFQLHVLNCILII